MDAFFKPREQKILCGRKLDVTKAKTTEPQKEQSKRLQIKFHETNIIPLLSCDFQEEFKSKSKTNTSQATTSTCYYLKNLVSISLHNSLDEECLFTQENQPIHLVNIDEKDINIFADETVIHSFNDIGVNWCETQDCPLPIEIPRLQVNNFLQKFNFSNPTYSFLKHISNFFFSFDNDMHTNVSFMVIFNIS